MQQNNIKHTLSQPESITVIKQLLSTEQSRSSIAVEVGSVNL